LFSFVISVFKKIQIVFIALVHHRNRKHYLPVTTNLRHLPGRSECYFAVSIQPTRLFWQGLVGTHTIGIGQCGHELKPIFAQLLYGCVDIVTIAANVLSTVAGVFFDVFLNLAFIIAYFPDPG